MHPQQGCKRKLSHYPYVNTPRPLSDGVFVIFVICSFTTLLTPRRLVCQSTVTTLFPGSPFNVSYLDCIYSMSTNHQQPIIFHVVALSCPHSHSMDSQIHVVVRITGSHSGIQFPCTVNVVFVVARAVDVVCSKKESENFVNSSLSQPWNEKRILSLPFLPFQSFLCITQ